MHFLRGASEPVNRPSRLRETSDFGYMMIGSPALLPIVGKTGRGNTPYCGRLPSLRSHACRPASRRPSLRCQNHTRTPATKLVVVGSLPSARVKSAVRPVCAT